MALLVRISQTRNAVGEPDPREFKQVIRTGADLPTLPEATMAFIRPLNPSRTGRIGTYEYRDPDRGSGTLMIKGADQLDKVRIDELVHLEDIYRAIGGDPDERNGTSAFRAQFAGWGRSPYAQMGSGLTGILSGLLVAALLFFLPGIPLWGAIVLGALGLIGCVLGVPLVFRGVRRVAWWHRARAEAMRDGGMISPELLEWQRR